jgi:hypothetical protein
LVQGDLTREVLAGDAITLTGVPWFEVAVSTSCCQLHFSPSEAVKKSRINMNQHDVMM